MIKNVFRLILFFLLLFVFSCSKDKPVEPIVAEDDFIRAADLSFLPLIESENTIFFNSNNQAENALLTLKNAGCNTVRIRLWKNPIINQSGLAEVKALALRVKQAGMKVWLSVHYSDTWADPGAQTIPVAWQNLSFIDLKTAVASYTSSVLTEIHPDVFQIGNEINNGFLWPEGHLINNENQCLQLLAITSSTIRTQSPSTKIMIHYAGINTGTDTGATWFFNKIQNIDYDYIGLSYYPIWHGKILVDVQNTINTLGQAHNKKVIIAETAYPFTLDYNDWTNNILGSNNQIITDYPATPDGQKNYLLALKNTIKQSPYGKGFGYWGTEWVAFRGNQSTNGSSYENQAMWDFNNKALPATQVFNP
jgi:arabinogalactan endo-1,4-beta-galactosidase